MIPRLLGWTPVPSLALLALLFAAHVLADFLVRSPDADGRTGKGRGYLTRVAAVLATHVLVLLPLLSVGTVVAALGIAVLHASIDWLSGRLVRGRPDRVGLFVLDQAIHVAVVLTAWAFLLRLDAIPEFRFLAPRLVGAWVIGAVVASAFVLNATGGSVVVRAVLVRLPGEGVPEAPAAGLAGAGRLIGILERTLVLALVLYGELGAVALLFAAKSIARFEELKVRGFAEYYLVGTLTSLLVALAIGFLLGDLLLPIVDSRQAFVIPPP